MSAKSRERKYIQLPIAQRDYIIGLQKADHGLVAQCASGRLFWVERVARYKRRFKVRELPALPT